MARYKPSELKQFLDSIGAGPKKSLSQNFLIDGNIIRKLAEDVKPGERILEIGPGPGALTEELVNAGAEVTAVELDRRFAEELKNFEGVRVFCEDILKFDLDAITPPARVIANIPYHLTSPILGKLAPRHDLFTSLRLTVQDEVARRMCASAGSADYSALTVFLNFYGSVKYLFKISKNCFYPVPKIDSATVEVILKKPPEDIDPEQFFKMTRQAFSQRRKTLKASLKGLVPPEKTVNALEKLGKATTARPEELSCEDFISLCRSLFF